MITNVPVLTLRLLIEEEFFVTAVFLISHFYKQIVIITKSELRYYFKQVYGNKVSIIDYTVLLYINIYSDGVYFRLYQEPPILSI
jgi:hypothetical protein